MDFECQRMSRNPNQRRLGPIQTTKNETKQKNRKKNDDNK